MGEAQHQDFASYVDDLAKRVGDLECYHHPARILKFEVVASRARETDFYRKLNLPPDSWVLSVQVVEPCCKHLENVVRAVAPGMAGIRRNQA